MQSTIHLYNAALAKLGGEQLPLNRSSLEDNTTGILCENIFLHILDLALSAHEWGFAKQRVALARLAQEEPGNPAYPYSYAVPSDCIKPVSVSIPGVSEGSDYSGWIIEGRSILCTTSEAELVYIARITDPRQWPAWFAEALAWKLAAELATARLNDQQKFQHCEQMYAYHLNEATAKDRAMQRPHRQSTPWQRARGNRGAC